MADLSQIILFAGQGSPNLFSEQAASTAAHIARSSPLASILFSRCHAAFLQELSSLDDNMRQEISLDVESFFSPESILKPDASYHKNPIIQSTTICIHQLLEFLSFVETSELDFKSALHLVTETAGFCSGVLPAIAVAASQTSEDYLHYGVTAFLTAFWLGLRSSLYCQKLSSGSSDDLPWSLVITGLKQREVQTKLDEFSEERKDQHLNLSAISSEHCVSISGPGTSLECFRAFLADSGSGKFAHVHGLYHGGPPLEKVVNEPVDWHKTALSISKHSSDFLDFNHSRSLEIVSIGPNGSSLLFDIKQKPRDRLKIVNWFQDDKFPKPVASGDKNAIAIVGMGINLPKGSTLPELWDTLSKCLSAAEEIPKTRFDISQYYSTDKSPAKKRKMTTKYGNFLKDPFSFDPGFFNISPREAKSLDPQQRTLLQTTLSALEDAGYVEDSTPTFQRSSFGSYIGVATGDYTDNLRDDIDVYYSTGTLRAFLSGKIAYAFKWSGPSIVLDTACSGSLLAIYQACRALQIGDCNAAIAGGVNVITSPDMYLGLSRAHFLSSTGQCKPFDGAADGYCRAEGCGIFVLKRLSDAVAEGDRIHGVIRGIEINQCGEADSITHPHPATQSTLFRQLLQKSNLKPADVDIVEAHGTGTQAGDYAEVNSLRAVFADGRKPKDPLIVSSIKGNIGHAEAASGSAGLAKLLLMLQHESIPPQASLTNVNPRLSSALGDSIRIPRHLVPWKPRGSNPRRALLNNFGAAGSNVALLLEEFRGQKNQDRNSPQRSAYLFNLSARNAPALQKRIEDCKKLIDTDNQLICIRDWCYTATARQTIYEHRVSFTCASKEELALKLAAQEHKISTPLRTSAPVIFAFSGQGGSYLGMGRELIETSTLFKNLVVKYDRCLQSFGFSSILPILQDEQSRNLTVEEEIIGLQCACVILEIALAKLWMSWGILPEYVVGHSLGEYAALAISGALSIEDAIRVVALRSRLMIEHCAADSSGMLACHISGADAQKMIESTHCFESLTVACFNGPKDCVVAGPIKDLGEFKTRCHDSSLKTKLLDIPYGFHSAAMDPIIPRLKDIGRTVEFKEPSISLGSNHLGRIAQKEDFNADYFASHARQQVKFVDIIRDLERQHDLDGATFLEIGPHPTSNPMIRGTLPAKNAAYLASLQKARPAWVPLCDSLSQLFLRGSKINWRAVFAGNGAQLVEIPGHPLEKGQYCVPYQEQSQVQRQMVSGATYDLLPGGLSPQSTKTCKVFETTLATLQDLIQGHAVGGIAICPASVFQELVLEAAHGIRLNSFGTVNVVKKMTFASPLIGNPSAGDTRIEVALEISAGEADVNFTVKSFAPNASTGTVHCSGTITSRSPSAIQSYLAAPLMTLQEQCAEVDKSSYNVFHTKMIYETIFSRVVVYSEPYHTLETLTISLGNDIAKGKFRVPNPKVNSNTVSSPYFSDTFLHTAGFMANMSVTANEICICGEVGATQILYPDIDLTKEYTIYCSLSRHSNGSFIGRAFAVDSSGNSVAVVDDMNFKIVRLASFQKHLQGAMQRKAAERRHVQYKLEDEQLSSSSDSEDWSPTGQTTGATTPQTVGEEGMLSLSLEDQQNMQARVLGIVGDLCGIPKQNLDPASDLNALGIDSMMQLELHSALKESFPNISPEPSDFHDCGTLQELIDLTLSSSASPPPRRPAIARLPSFIRKLAADSLKRQPSRVLEILKSVCMLEDSQLSPGQTLESLGIDSLMFIEIEQELKRELKVSSDQLHSCQTVGDLLALEQGPLSSRLTPPEDDAWNWQKSSVGESLPVRLQKSESTSSPLFLVHDGSGLCSMYSRLGAQSRALFGFYNPLLLESNFGRQTLVDIAADYVSRIQTAANEAIILGGWSFGGVVAFEMAKQLRKANRRVKGVVLIDSPPPVHHEPLPEAVIKHVLKSALANGKSAPRLLSQFTTHASMLAKYNPPAEPCDFKVVTITCRDTMDTNAACGVPYRWLSSKAAQEEAKGTWEGLVGKECPGLEVPGNHFEVFAPANIEETSRQIRRACEIIESEG
ncbi:MAG: hypothetical protein Q9160_005227 [Pyrenula sp. 1 TL-2023]